MPNQDDSDEKDTTQIEAAKTKNGRSTDDPSWGPPNPTPQSTTLEPPREPDTIYATTNFDRTPLWSPHPAVKLVPNEQFQHSAAVMGVHRLTEKDLEALKSGIQPEPRYEQIEDLGHGGMGLVKLVRDKLLKREVALKTPNERVESKTELLDQFIHEALITIQLEHPNIVPGYDIVVQNGRVGYVMRRLQGNRLSAILDKIKSGDEETVDAYGPVRLLTVFQQIVAAVAYAHDQGVIHRDLKPSNVMVGNYGEVLVIDWGLAMNIGVKPFTAAARAGQPPYMSPEQYQGRPEKLDGRSDIYSLGALLYELLTLELLHEPGEGYSDWKMYMEKCLTEAIIPPEQRAPNRNISSEVRDICMRCLAYDAADRYQRTTELLADVVSALEGTRERQFRVKAAERHVREAEVKVEIYDNALQKARDLARQVRQNHGTVCGWDPIETKRARWQLEDDLKQAEHEVSVAFHEAENMFYQALGHDPENENGKRGLLEFYYQRFLREEDEMGGGRHYFKRRVLAFGDPEYDTRLLGDGRLKIVSNPPGAHIELFHFRSADRIFETEHHRTIGKTGQEVPIEMGSYLAKVSLEGHRTVDLPFRVGRLQTVQIEVSLFPPEHIGEGFIFVPAGVYLRGGDMRAVLPTENDLAYVDNFAIAKFPVTSGQYLEFLNDIWRIDPKKAEQLVPRMVESKGPKWPGGQSGPYQIPEHDPEGDLWKFDFPICLVTWENASAYAKWLSKKHNKPYRLPTSSEWEKAGRGVDGRIYPWGNHWDPGFCKNAMARQGLARPEEVGAFPTDCSPYGVQDMAGGSKEWCLDLDPEGGGKREARGGSWGGLQKSCRLASRHYFRPEARYQNLGFRLCFSL